MSMPAPLLRILEHQGLNQLSFKANTFRHLNTNFNLYQNALRVFELGSPQHDIFRRFSDAGATVKLKLEDGELYLSPKTYSGQKLPRIPLPKATNPAMANDQYQEVANFTEQAIDRAKEDQYNAVVLAGRNRLSRQSSQQDITRNMSRPYLPSTSASSAGRGASSVSVASNVPRQPANVTANGLDAEGFNVREMELATRESQNEVRRSANHSRRQSVVLPTLSVSNEGFDAGELERAMRESLEQSTRSTRTTNHVPTRTSPFQVPQRVSPVSRPTPLPPGHNAGNTLSDDGFDPVQIAQALRASEQPSLYHQELQFAQQSNRLFDMGAYEGQFPSTTGAHQPSQNLGANLFGTNANNPFARAQAEDPYATGPIPGAFGNDL